ncbi:MAG: deoxynucleoside kinase, partial [Chloroflexi bacterium]|nr:deoxynucleoside kinase [Chloroflexota bacterium]
MAKKLILVAGNIGSGKTSLTERIGERLGWRTAYESVADNPYLSHFYADMRQWSFHLQVFFLGHRAKQHLELWQDPRSAIIDRSIYEDAYIFARALHHMGNLNEMLAGEDMEGEMRRIDGMINSMTADERRNPSRVIDQSRRRRIAAGAGV